MNKGRLFILSGPSGSGKDTILNEFLKDNKDIKLSMSTVSRPMRKDETQDSKYHHVSKEEFLNLLNKNEFLEYNEYLGNYYGTPKTPVLNAINNGIDMIVEIDVNGAGNIRKSFPDAISVFIVPPSLKTLKERLIGRGTETEEQIEKRLNKAFDEISRANEFDYIICNDDLKKAVNDLNSIIKSNRLKYERQIELLERVQKTC